jgi:alkanesulfonate monooxygenase SsuD/methylene tetrahydromethanopterin reductase-like flavin-dependent oxidoreductase (luciferase family)
VKLTLFLNPEHRSGDDIGAKVGEHADQVRLARALGYDGITVGHHLCYGSSVWLPPFETLARMVVEAEGMHIGTCMLLLPLFEPAHVAQQAALLDELLAGRVIIGSPEECAESLVELCRRCGTNRVVARVQWMAMEQRVVLRTIELLAERVRPLVEAALAPP